MASFMLTDILDWFGLLQGGAAILRGKYISWGEKLSLRLSYMRTQTIDTSYKAIRFDAS